MSAALPYRVLVVDDVAQNVQLAEVLLRSQGYEVETASDGQQALAAVEREPPDLILLDVMMPVLDGFAVTRRIKEHRDWRHIPIVLLTSLESTQDRVIGIEAGADDFISKPFDRHELLARVKSLVRVKRLEEAERDRVRHTFERYVDPSVAHEMLDSQELAAPGGRLCDASVLFVDVRGFSTWAAGETPGTVVEVLNQVLQRAVEVVFRHGGTVDKFLGDGLMALFGVPVHHPEHLRHAVAVALELDRAASTISHPRLLSGPPRIGCGVNSGEMVVGNLGSERRLDYTAIGSAVNLAKRLEEIAGAGQVLVTEECYRALGSPLATDLGPRQLKGASTPLRVFDLAWPEASL